MSISLIEDKLDTILEQGIHEKGLIYKNENLNFFIRSTSGPLCFVDYLL